MKATGNEEGAGRRGCAGLKDDDLLSKPKAVQVPSLEVVACRAWKNKHCVDLKAAEESVRVNLSALLKDVAKSYSDGRVDRECKMMLSFSWVGRGDRDLADSLIE